MIVIITTIISTITRIITITIIIMMTTKNYHFLIKLTQVIFIRWIITFTLSATRHSALSLHLLPLSSLHPFQFHDHNHDNNKNNNNNKDETDRNNDNKNNTTMMFITATPEKSILPLTPQISSVTDLLPNVKQYGYSINNANPHNNNNHFNVIGSNHSDKTDSKDINNVQKHSVPINFAKIPIEYFNGNNNINNNNLDSVLRNSIQRNIIGTDNDEHILFSSNAIVKQQQPSTTTISIEYSQQQQQQQQQQYHDPIPDNIQSCRPNESLLHTSPTSSALLPLPVSFPARPPSPSPSSSNDAHHSHFQQQHHVNVHALSSSSVQVHIRSVYPPIQEMQPRILFVVVIFVLCFIVGMCGNASILTIIRGVISERRRLKKTSLCAASRARLRRHAGEQTILYIAALCVVDLLMSLSLPPAILDSIIGFWMFGTVLCKLHHICGSVGRIVSTFLITAMSFDRYVAVCHPHKHAYRSRRFVLTVISGVCAVAFLLLLPMLTYARANEVILHQLRQTDPLHKRENITRVRIYKCSDMMPPYVFYWFTCSTFLLGYVVPLLLIVYFNLKLIRKLYRHAKIQPRSGIPLRRVVTYTLLIAVFYFLCWTPYWCSVLYAIYMSIFSDGRTKTNELLLFIIYCVHLLPYFGSASNWILYGLLNTQLQQKHDSPTAIHRSPNAIPCSHSPLRSL